MAEARTSDLNKSVEENTIQQIEKLTLLIDNSQFHDHQDSLGILYYAIAFRYEKLKEFEELITYSTKAIQVFEDFGFDGYQLAKCYFYRADANQKLGEVEKALEDFDVIINSLKIEGQGYFALWKAYTNKAANFRLTGEFESAIHYLNSFVESERFARITDRGKATIFRELSLAYSMYSSIEKIELAKDFITKAEKICSSFDKSNVLLFEQLVLNVMHKAYINWNLEKRDLAIVQYEQALALIDDPIGNSTFKELFVICLINLAQVHLELDQCEQAIGFIVKAEDLFSNSGNPNYIELESELLMTKADSYICNQDYDLANAEFQTAKELLLVNRMGQSIKSLRSYPLKEYLIDNFYSEIQLINLDREKDTNDRISQLKLKTIELDSLVNYYLEDMYFNSSMWEVKDNLDGFYKLAIDISFESNDLDDFWYYSEQRSNILLLKNQQNNQEEKIPSREKLDKSITDLMQEASTLENMLYFSKDSTEIFHSDSIKSRLVQVKSEQLVLLEKRSANTRMETVNTISLNEFEHIVDDNTTILHYQFGTDSLYVLKIDSEQKSLHKIAKSSEVRDLISDWFSLLSNENDSKSALSSLDTVAHLLYTYLVKPLGKLNYKVVVIPDEELSNLSFDALKDSNNEYLIHNHSIHFDLSGTFAFEHNEIETIVVDTASAFLPTYRNSELAQLSNSANDVKSLQQTNNLKIFSDAETSRSLFIQSLRHSNLVHFGGHAILVDEDNQYSHLALIGDADDVTNVISLGDLYSMNNISSLIALPACNTGAGSLLQGEGISSLARGFFYAGANAVISSLWSVNDRSTSQIMDSFYENLNSGESTSEALRLAKLNYLAEAPDFLKHPYMWSGLILTGSDSLVELSKPSHFLVKLGLALLFLLGIGYFIISRFNSTNIEAEPN